MAASNEVPIPSRDDTTEIAGDLIFQYRSSLRAVLENVCLSPIFRSSPKSCEFIRHVVDHTLEGRVDELKERLIGMSLLGRNASYDTSTDSGVRVRANYVRKRLVQFNEGEGAQQDFRITLPTGTYVPRFFRVAVIEAPSAACMPEELPPRAGLLADVDDLPKNWPRSNPPLSLFQLAVPTLAAVFLCIVCMRWQLSQEQSFTDFWHKVFEGDQALLYLAPAHGVGKENMVAIEDVNQAAPLLDLVAQFHRKLTVVSEVAPSSASGQMSLFVGLGSTGDLPSRNPYDRAEHFELISRGADRMVVDRRHGSQTGIRHAALLTIINGRQRSLYIDGTDESAIRSLVNRLCDETSFPSALTDSFQPNTITQAMFPVDPHGKAVLDRQTLSRDLAARETP